MDEDNEDDLECKFCQTKSFIQQATAANKARSVMGFVVGIVEEFEKFHSNTKN